MPRDRNVHSYEAALPPGIRSRVIDDINSLSMHVLEAGEAGRPCVLLLHGFPELAYSWRKIMLPLAAAGYRVVAPDQRGYGRTAGSDNSYDGDPDSFRILNLVRDTLGLVAALGETSVAVVGHDFGSPVAANCALIRPEVFRRLALMSSPYAGPPTLPERNAAFADPRSSPSRGLVFDELAKLDPPRKHYQRYYQTREANENMLRAPQGLHAFLRGYYHVKSADWKVNRPFALAGFTASELAKVPGYYIMPLGKGMAETVADDMPSAAEIAACGWLTEDELAVYAGEFARTGFQGGLNWYRCTDAPRQHAELQIFSGRTIDVPAASSRAQATGACTSFPARSSGCRRRPCAAISAARISSRARATGCSRSSPPRGRGCCSRS